MPNELLFYNEINNILDISIHKISKQLEIELKYLFTKPIQTNTNVILICYHSNIDMSENNSNVDEFKQDIINKVFLL